ncbi:hypothetical protein M758_1G051700 [Ceratodon purpureus]|nr:hypothetical protein M758_1G051700 [Ceratodon purpureus]
MWVIWKHSLFMTMEYVRGAVQLRRKLCREPMSGGSAMGGFSRIVLWGVKGVLLCALLLHLPGAEATLHGIKHTPVVDVNVYSKVAEINSSTQARFVPMFGAPGDIDSSRDDGSTIRLRLESHSGSGIVSQNSVFRGFFNAAIKLPCGVGGDSAGIVSAFYTSNGGTYPSNHDEIDMEFLGVRPGQPYVVQTNIYADGSTGTGREERFHLWFDPTVDFHNYSILWTYHHIVFFIDDIPIRRYVNRPEQGIQYPAKPMNAYATIWDGSTWATEGGQYHVNYTQGPFDATFTNFKLEGCVWDPTIQITPPECAMPTYKAWFNDNEMQEMSDKQLIALEWARSNFMWYSYCDDQERYPVHSPPECPRRLGNLNSIVTSGTPPSARKGPWRKTPKSKPVTRPKPATLPPVPGHKHKKRNKPSKFEASHYLPYSLWKTTFEVKLLKEDMIEN